MENINNKIVEITPENIYLRSALLEQIDIVQTVACNISFEKDFVEVPHVILYSCAFNKQEAEPVSGISVELWSLCTVLAHASPKHKYALEKEPDFGCTKIIVISVRDISVFEIQTCKNTIIH